MVTTLFVSYSAKTPQETRVLSEVVDLLHGLGFTLFIDKENIDKGAFWRATINMCLGLCQGGIIIVTNSALTSKHVAYEASVLTYRARYDPTFKVIPLFAEPDIDTRLRESLLSELHLNEIQAASSITDLGYKLPHFGNLLVHEDDDIERLVLYMCDLLQYIPDHEIEEHATRIYVFFDHWLPAGMSNKKALALKMLGLGLHDCEAIIRDFRCYFSSPHLVKEMIDLCAISWIDTCAIQGIRAALSVTRPLALNASQGLTAQMYTMRASPTRPRDPWKCIEVDGIVGEGGIKELIDQIQFALCRHLACRTHAELNRFLGIMSRRKEYVFVAVPIAGFAVDDLRRLTDYFPDVVMFFLYGNVPFSAKTFEQHNIQCIYPLLDDECEEIICRSYRESLLYLLGKQ